MRTNEHVAVSTSKIILVPYAQCHVPTYHDWMKDTEIQAATASEPLSLNEEYAMQQSWRHDADKLTFILCTPPPNPDVSFDHKTEIAAMVGDVNMFVSIQEEEDGTPSLIGEVELMIALKTFQRKGYGRAALLTFLRYVMQHETEIVKQFLDHTSHNSAMEKFDYFTAKIKEENERSMRLFESTGFKKVSTVPNFFGEFELRCLGSSVEVITRLMEDYYVEAYEEVEYSTVTDAVTA